MGKGAEMVPPCLLVFNPNLKIDGGERKGEQSCSVGEVNTIYRTTPRGVGRGRGITLDG